MNYQSLRDHWNKYDRDSRGQIKRGWDTKYAKSIRSGMWAIPVSRINEKIQFLKDWGCIRVPAISDLVEYSERFATLLQEVASLNLLTITPQIQGQLTQIYRLLAQIHNLGPTGISKYLHMHHRDLFIMWDNQIFRDYFHRQSSAAATPERYVNFMFRMRKEAQDALHTFPAPTSLSEPQKIIAFRSNFNNETLPRLLDKYNYATRNQPKDRIW